MIVRPRPGGRPSTSLDDAPRWASRLASDTAPRWYGSASTTDVHVTSTRCRHHLWRLPAGFVRKSTSRRSPTRRRLRRSIPEEDRCCHRSARGSRRTTSRSSGLQQLRARRRARWLRSDRRPRALEAFRSQGSGAFSARRGPVDRDPLTPLLGRSGRSASLSARAPLPFTLVTARREHVNARRLLPGPRRLPSQGTVRTPSRAPVVVRRRRLAGRRGCCAPSPVPKDTG
jgi:hypothetical protein